MKNSHKAIGVIVFFMLQCMPILGSQINLEKTKLLIDYKDVGYFKAITDLEIYNDFLTICDFFGRKVLEYKLNAGKAEFIRFIGQFGQGPGDIQRPFAVSISDNTIAIKDQENVAIFSINGNYISKFKDFSSFIDLSLFDKTIFIAGISANDNLIACYSMEGRELASFNKKYLSFAYALEGPSAFMIERQVYDGSILADGESVYFLNRKFGIVQKYSPNGEMILKRDILPILGTDARINAEKNTDLFLKNEFRVVSGKGIPVYEAFRESKLVGDDIYILLNHFERSGRNMIEIISIDKRSLELKNRYQLSFAAGEQVRQFAATIEKGEPVFIACIRSSDGMEDLYRIRPSYGKAN